MKVRIFLIFFLGWVHADVYCGRDLAFFDADTITDVQVKGTGAIFGTLQSQQTHLRSYTWGNRTFAGAGPSISIIGNNAFIAIDQQIRIYTADSLNLLTSYSTGINIKNMIADDAGDRLFVWGTNHSIYVFDCQTITLDLIERFDSLHGLIGINKTEWPSFGNQLAFNEIDGLFIQTSSDGIWMLNITDGTASSISDSGDSNAIFMTSDAKYLITTGRRTSLRSANGTWISDLNDDSDSLTVAFDLSDSSNPIIYNSQNGQITSYNLTSGTNTSSEIHGMYIPPSNAKVSIRRFSSETYLIAANSIIRDSIGPYSVTCIIIITLQSRCPDDPIPIPYPQRQVSSTPSSTLVSFQLIEPSSSDASNGGIIAAIVVSIVGAFAIAGASIAFFIFRKKRKFPANNFQLENLSVQDRLGAWKIDSKELHLGELLGSGAYGMVFKGKWRNAEVAVKQLKDSDVSNDTFLKEALQMKELRSHPNVCKFLGVVMQPEFPVSIVTEFVANGSLWNLIKSGEFDFSYRVCVSLVRGTASGMAHIHEQGILHCDLAARNLLVERRRDELVVKVADFGLSHMTHTDTYDINARVALPVRWCAPEVFENHEFSKSADVWSFGIVMWEIAENSIPYFNLNVNNDVVKYVKEGGRLQRPRRIDVADEYYNLMRSCWDRSAEDRPTFKVFSS